MKPYKTSKEKYTIDDENDVYSYTRSIHHTDIIEKVLLDAEENDEKFAILLGGGSGAGKSRFIKGFLERFRQITGLSLTIINADSIKKSIDDFIHWKEISSNPNFENEIDCKDPNDFVHDESSDISTIMIDKSIEKGLSFVYDGTFKDLEKYEGLIKDLRDENYKITAFILDVSLDVALDRVEARSVRTGRTVPEHVVELSNYMVAQTFIELKKSKLMPPYSIFNNSINDVEPRLIAEVNEDGEEMIYNSILYNEFISKSTLSKE